MLGRCCLRRKYSKCSRCRLIPNRLEWRSSAVQQYRRRERTLVIAVRLDLNTDGFTYLKWGGTQRCKRGDWIVNNQGDVYTIDTETFERTYQMVSPGMYEKVAPVWAEVAAEAGTIPTKEGSTAYLAGDYLVFNAPDRKDGYAMEAETFCRLYESND